MFKFALALAILFGSAWALAKDCVQKIKKDSIKVEWTGYKTTEKVGVTGRFLKSTLTSPESGKDIHAIVSGAKFSINGLKFDAGNFARNSSLKKHFFKLFADKAIITGEVKEMPKGPTGELKLILIANGVRSNVPMKYEINGNKFKSTGQIEMSDFKLENALASISKKCFELHKGKDGISKTWPTVDLMASAEFEEVCK